jgi:hypothetical protein
MRGWPGIRKTSAKPSIMRWPELRCPRLQVPELEFLQERGKAPNWTQISHRLADGQRDATLNLVMDI